MMVPKATDLVLGNCEPLSKKDAKLLELITAVDLHQKQRYGT